MVEITYRGVDHVGNGRGGRLLVESVHTFVHVRFAAGWTSLSVHQEVEGGSHRLVGRIEVDPATGRRTWWAE